jgi:hypothetical protein
MQYKFKDKMTNLALDFYLSNPTPYIVKNYESLLPNWQSIPQQLMIFLFQAKLELAQESQFIAQEKDRLKTRFIELANDFKSSFYENVEIICPQMGIPINTQINDQLKQKTFDLVAMVNQSLLIKFQGTDKDCKLLNYNKWKTATYPCLIVSNKFFFIEQINDIFFNHKFEPIL